jgi:hypothetical protein
MKLTKTKVIVLAVTTTPALLALLFVAALLSGNVKIRSGDETAAGLADQQEKASQFFDAFPLKEYASFEEAEQAAGYHIPHPSPEYPPSFGRTHLRWFPQFERPLSETHYSYPPEPSVFIYVIVSPSYFSNDPATLTSGHSMTIGGKSGWMQPDDDDFLFNYPCGQVDGYEVWCSVSALKEIGENAFEQFMSTLQ